MYDSLADDIAYFDRFSKIRKLYAAAILNERNIMKILITGSTGHIGSFLVPRLVDAGHEVLAVARHPQPKYPFAKAQWDKVQWVVADCREEESSGCWAGRLAEIKCDAVVDLISYTVEQVKFFVDAFSGRIRHFLHCGSIWAYGPSDRVPHLEEYPRHPQSQYGKNKTAIENYLMELHASKNFPATVIHPGHISGRYWLPIDPQGSINGLDVYKKLATEQPVHLPNNGLDALHHVHADDVAQLFALAIANPDKSIGQAFSAVSPYGMTLKGCCRAIAKKFGKTGNICFVSPDELKKEMGEKPFAITLSHLNESVIASPQKAQKILGFKPAYTTEEIYSDFLDYQMEIGQLIL